MKRSLFLSLILASLGSLPSYGLFSLDNASSYAYQDGEGSWTASNLSYSLNNDGSVTLSTDEGNLGSGYNVTVALTLDLSQLESVSGATQIFQLGEYWGLGTAADGTLTGYWGGSPSSTYVLLTDISTSESGYLTLVMTQSSAGTDLYAGGKTYHVNGLQGSTSANASTLTISSWAADAVVGIATWASSVTGSPAGAAISSNIMAGLTNQEAVVSPSVWQNDAFVSSRDDGSSIGRVTFIGDSITEGISDQTWRYQLFKTLVDNGIEFEIAGLREGYDAGYLPTDPETEYGGQEFDNTHMGKSSGRTFGLVNNGGLDGAPSVVDGINLSGANIAYGYNIADTAALNSDTYIMLIGTNDLLSDTRSSATESAFAAVMENLLGGSVVYDEASSTYVRTAGTGTGNMGTLLDTLKQAEANDTVYLMTVPTWGTQNPNHGNHDTARDAVAQYNGLLASWVDDYNASNSGANVKLIDINDGLVDVSTGKFQAVNSFFNSSDGIHPTEQGSLIIASNLAAGMGLAGRTAGQQRMEASALEHQAGSVSLDANSSWSDLDVFTGGGYTISLDLAFGDGAENGWSTTDTLTLQSGNGTVSGTLTITEAYIKWGDTILFSRDMSENSETLRLAYITGDKANANLGEGYYVWLDDKLIGQELEVTYGSSLNGVKLGSTLETQVNNLAYSNGSYAPGSTGITSAENAYYATAAQPHPTNAESIGSGINFDGATTSSTEFFAVNSSAATSGDVVKTFTGNTTVNGTVASWYGAKTGNGMHTGDIAMQVKASGKTGVLFGVINSTGGVNGNVTVVLNNDEAEILSYTSTKYGIVGGYRGGITGTFTAVVEGGTLGHVVGGYTDNAGNYSIGATKVIINNGTITGNVYGGSVASAGKILKDTEVFVTGGHITGNVYGGGSGTIGGTTNVTISGGIIDGNVYGGSAGALEGNVTVQGTCARIGGEIRANHVTLKEVADSGMDFGFDTYSGTITANTLTLSGVTLSSLASTISGLTALEVTDKTQTSLTMPESVSLASLTMTDGTSLGVYQANAGDDGAPADRSTLTVTQVLSVGTGASLEAGLMIASGTSLEMESSLAVASGVALEKNLTLSGDILSTLYSSGKADLFTGVESFTVAGEAVSSLTSEEVQELFSNLDGGQVYGLSYDGSSVTLTVAAVPEPATATLSLLALAALAARRRRK